MASLYVLTAHWYGTSGSAVPWNSRLGASPVVCGLPTSFAPESETAAPTLDEKPALPLVPGSSELAPTLSAVIAPADVPAIAMRSGSTLYVVAFLRRKRTAACASC